MRRLGTLVSLALILAFAVVSPALAAGDQQYGPGFHSILGKYRYYTLSSFIGQDLRNPSGDILGRVEDVVLNSNGSIDYLVVAKVNGPEATSELVAVPWQMVKDASQGDALIADVPQAQFSTAQGFDRNNWPQIYSPEWNQKTFGYYSEDIQHDE